MCGQSLHCHRLPACRVFDSAYELYLPPSLFFLMKSVIIISNEKNERHHFFVGMLLCDSLVDMKEPGLSLFSRCVQVGVL